MKKTLPGSDQQQCSTSVIFERIGRRLMTMFGWKTASSHLTVEVLAAPNKGVWPAIANIDSEYGSAAAPTRND